MAQSTSRGTRCQRSQRPHRHGVRVSSWRRLDYHVTIYFTRCVSDTKSLLFSLAKRIAIYDSETPKCNTKLAWAEESYPETRRRELKFSLLLTFQIRTLKFLNTILQIIERIMSRICIWFLFKQCIYCKLLNSPNLVFDECSSLYGSFLDTLCIK